MDVKQIIEKLSLLSMQDLRELSEAVEGEMNPPLGELDAWRSQNPDRKFEWVVHEFHEMCSVALVLFHGGDMDLYKGKSTSVDLAKRVAMRSALRKIESDKDCPEYDKDESDKDKAVRCISDSDESDIDDEPSCKKITRKFPSMKKPNRLYKLGEIETDQGVKLSSMHLAKFDFRGKTPLKAAEKFFGKLTNFDGAPRTYTFSLTSKTLGEKERKFFFKGSRNIKPSVSPIMKWDEDKKIYTDGEFVYTSLEKIYARLLLNEKLRPLTTSEVIGLKSRGIQCEKVSMEYLLDIQKQQDDSEESSSEADSDSSSSEADSDSSSSEADSDELSYCCERVTRGKGLCGKPATKCIKYPNSNVMWFCGNEKCGCYKVKMDELRRQEKRVHMKSEKPSEETSDSSEDELRRQEKRVHMKIEKPSEETSDSSEDETCKLGHVHWCPKYRLYTDGKFVYNESTEAFGKLCSCKESPCIHGDGYKVHPLVLSDIFVLKESKIEVVKQLQPSRIKSHVIESRKFHATSELKNIAKRRHCSEEDYSDEERVYSDNELDGCG
uniref:Uncharacterized protein n=1 Tax=Marseillevirus LCMAC101 TaxID=2506602 RepID=A0A481YSZ1_9VIRU|nr:MAG: hypothetical protein LCMAC101_06160 [Marseillevirus LCMAC101]